MVNNMSIVIFTVVLYYCTSAKNMWQNSRQQSYSTGWFIKKYSYTLCRISRTNWKLAFSDRWFSIHLQCKHLELDSYVMASKKIMLYYLSHRYSTWHGTDYKTGLCLSVCVSVCGHSHGRISWSIFTKIGTDV